MTRWVALALLAAMTPTGSAAFQARESLARGGSYFDQCVARAKDYSACIGYFMGMADAPVMNADKSADQAVYCLPAGAHSEQNRAVLDRTSAVYGKKWYVCENFGGRPLIKKKKQ